MILASRIALVLMTILGLHNLLMVPATILSWITLSLFGMVDNQGGILLGLAFWAASAVGILRYREGIWNRKLPATQNTSEVGASLAAVLLVLGTMFLLEGLFGLSQMMLWESKLSSTSFWSSITSHTLGLLAGGLLFFGAWPIAEWWDKQPGPSQGDPAESPVITEP